MSCIQKCDANLQHPSIDRACLTEYSRFAELCTEAAAKGMWMNNICITFIRPSTSVVLKLFKILKNEKF